jgi:uncharacterized protein DUF3788
VQIWKNQFEKPSLKALSNGLDDDARARYARLKKALVDGLGTKSKLEWMGMSWGWCETIRGRDGGMLIGVHLIASPEQVRAAMTLSTAFFEQYRLETLPRSLHDGISTATCVGHQTWCEWAIGSQEAVDAVIELAMLARGGTR